MSRGLSKVLTLAFSPNQGLLHSSIAAWADHAVSPFYGSVLTQNTINAKMQQLALNPHQGKSPVVQRVGLPDNTCGRPAQSLCQLASLDTSASVEICAGDDSGIPGQQYNFRQISEIQNLHNGDMVDFLGVVMSVSPCVTIIRKGGMETQKRTLQLKDMSGSSVVITLWRNVCNAEGQLLYSMCVSGFDPVLALKGGRVNEFKGKSVGTVSSSLLKVNPDIPGAERLMQWFITEGEFAGCTSLSQEISSVSKTIVQIKQEGLGRSDKPDWITVEGAISYINTERFCYPACTMELDGKRCCIKVTYNGAGTWRCPKCEQSSRNCEQRRGWPRFYYCGELWR